MIRLEDAEKVLNQALETGANYAEIFAEDTTSNVIEYVGGMVTKCLSNAVYGAGIHILKDGKEVYGYTSDLSLDSLLALAKKLSESFTGKRNHDEVSLTFKEAHTKHFAKQKNDAFSKSKKIEILDNVYDVAKKVNEEITQVMCYFTDKDQDVFIYNSLGTATHDNRFNTRIMINVVASDGKDTQSMSGSYGENAGFEIYDNEKITTLAKQLAEKAVVMLHADEMVGGEYPVVIHNGFGGVILHEACVHGLEAASVAKGLSVFANKLGTKIASDIVNACDDGTIENAWGSESIDDEGTPTKRNILIENGILKSYLVDRKNTGIMNHPLTGSGRRESYRYAPTARMTNTFFLPGDSKYEDIIKNTKFGLFAKQMGGGSVDPSTGEFQFAVTEGYMIEDGKITKPVRGATLVGNGADVLLKIDMIADNLAMGQGMCGAQSGSIPTNVGQPTIRVSKMTVGGKGGKN